MFSNQCLGKLKINRTTLFSFAKYKVAILKITLYRKLWVVKYSEYRIVLNFHKICLKLQNAKNN